jgi:peptide subunit release factor 1 (eRF1)
MNPKELNELLFRPERPHRSILSVYLDVDQSRPANLNRGFETQLKSTLSSIESTIRDAAELERFAQTGRRLVDFISTYEPESRVLALFFDETDDFFRHVELDVNLPAQARWDREFFLQPLAHALSDSETYGIVLVDRNNLRLLTVFLGHIREQVREGFGSKRVRHIKTVGMDHLGSASRAQRKADERVRLNLRHVIKMTEWLIQAKELNRVILAGTPEVTAELKRLLPNHLATRIMGTVNVAMDAQPSDILAATKPIAEQFGRDAELDTVGEMVTIAEKTDKAVLGLRHTLKALNSDRVWELVYSHNLRAAGFECSKCAALFSAGKAACQYCGGAIQAVSDIVERAVEHALRNGAKIEPITGQASASLDNSGGIGAFLKRRTGTVLV